MTKIAIKILNEEHGQKVKEYFKSLGAINYKDYYFNSIKEYYFFDTVTRCIDLTFNEESRQGIKKLDCKIITLPEEKSFPREMLVSYDNNFKTTVKRLVIAHYKGEINDAYIAVQYGYERYFEEGKYFEVMTWKYAKELPEESVKTPLQLEFEELQNKIKELQIKANEIKTKL